MADIIGPPQAVVETGFWNTCKTQLIEGAYDQGQTIILSSHRLEEVADMAQHIAILHQGRLVEAGPLADLLERDQLVTLRVSNQVSDLAGIPGASGVDQHAQQATIYVRGFDQRKVADALAVRGVTEWTHHAVSLEQLFTDRVTAHVE